MTTGRRYTSRDIHALGATTALWLLFSAVGDGLSAVAAMIDLSVMGGMARYAPLDEYGSYAGSEALYWTTFGLRLPQLILIVVTIVLSARWIYRASRNAHARVPTLSVRPPWAVGWFFIPLANLWMPFKSMIETWKVSHAAEGWRSLATPGHLIGWWICWVASNVIGNFTFRLGWSAGDVGQLNTATIWEMFSTLLHLAAALLFRRIVLEVTAAQSERLNTEVF